MSADAWSVCPRCAARGDIGYRETEFREDYEIGQDEGVVTVRYRGECQRCGLLFEFEQEHPVPGVPEVVPGPRTGEARQLTWGTVPAGWYVRTPHGEWMLITATHKWGGTGEQHVTMGSVGTWPRDPNGPVTACPGPSNATDAAIEALGFPRILEDGA